MSFIEWTPALSVENEALDNDHKEFVAFIDSIHTALNEGRIVSVTEDLLATIKDHGLQHFEREEALFSKTAYPDVAFHKKQHQFFAEKIVEAADRFRKEPDREQSLAFLLFLKKWLINHIQDVDRQYVPYLRKSTLCAGPSSSPLS